MASQANRVQVDLGALGPGVEARVRSGAYASADEVIQAGLQALEREEAATEARLSQLAEEALADPRPLRPAGEVFAELRARHGLLAGRSQW
jgi:putative addiction module CopG family antidote